MRSSTLVLTFSLLASIAPSLAVRQGSPYARDELSGLLSREEMDLLSRELESRGFWSDFGHGFVKGFTGTAKVLAPIATALIKREDIELLGREIQAQSKGDTEAEALSWKQVNDFFKGAGQVVESAVPFVQAAAHLKGRELADAVYARAVLDLRDEIKERNFLSDFGHGFVKGFTKTAETLAPVVKAFVKREDQELILRDLDERGFWSDFGHGFVKGFTGTAKALAPIATALIKREELEILAREIQSRELEERNAWDHVEHFFEGAGQVIESVTPYVQAAAPHLKGRGYYGDELEARNFGDHVKHFFQGAGQVVESMVPFVSAAAPHLKGREFEDDLFVRSMYDLD